MKRKEFERGDQVRVIATMDSGLTNQLLTKFFCSAGQLACKDDGKNVKKG